jgi:hypothetical protein
MSARAPEGFRVLLSATVPRELVEHGRVFDWRFLVQRVAHGILSFGGTVVCSTSPVLFPLFRGLATVPPMEGGGWHLFHLAGIGPLPADWETLRQGQSTRVTLVGEGRPGDHESIRRDLDLAGRLMVEEAQAGIFIGGSTTGHLGPTPRVRAEYQLLRAKRPPCPAYLVGLLGCETEHLIRDLEHNTEREFNGLSCEELRVLHQGDDVHRVAAFVLSDLKRILPESEFS